MEKLHTYYVYAYIDPATGVPFYIGKGRGQRATTHLRPCHLGKAVPLYLKLRKIISSGLKPEIAFLQTALSDDEAQLWEKFFIAGVGRLCDQSGPLFNLTLGGEGQAGRRHSFETKQKMSLAAKGRIPTEDARRKMSLAAKNRSPEIQKKIADSRRGRIVSDETRKQMSDSRAGHPTSEATRKKISAAIELHHSLKHMTRIPESMVFDKNDFTGPESA